MPSDEANFLKCVDRKLQNIRLKSEFVNDCFYCLNESIAHPLFITRSSDPVYLLHMMKIQEAFLPQVRERVKITGIRHIINGGSLNMLWASAFVSMDGHSALQTRPRIRHVYLVSETLASSNSSENPCETGNSTKDLQLKPPFRIPTFEHWALVVDSLKLIGTHEFQTLRGSASLASVHPGMKMLRCELVNDRRNAGVCASCGVIAEGRIRPLMMIGYTLLSNKAIRKQGRPMFFPISYDQED